VYTPPTYRSNRQRLPVLYLFRGHENEWINPHQDSSRQGRTVIDVYEELMQEGRVGPMILVFPGISSDDNSLSGLLVNFKYPDIHPKAGIGSGRFADYFLHELMPFVDGHYRTSPRARAVDGFSLGGFMALKTAAQYPQVFCSAGAYDGLFFWDDPDDTHTIGMIDQTFRNPIFDQAFGAERDRRYAAAHNPMNLIRNGEQAALQRVTWLIEYAAEVREPNDSNFYRGDRLCTLLAEKNIVNQGRGELKTSGHSWWCADEHMRHVLPLHWQALSARMGRR
jgi:S-formylglutathione hydrolase FrmB